MTMISQLQSSASAKIVYPESDGKPIADNTKQFRWIVVIQQNLEWLFADMADIFIAGDLLWYPVEGKPNICTAPDVMVVWGQPKGDRGSYKQWQENNTPPQVVFEILSPSNTLTEMNKKQVFYQRHGVEEYYVYDPDSDDLSGWFRGEDGFDVIDPIDQWISPRLQIRFDCSSSSELQIYRPDGKLFLSYVEIAQQADQERQRADQEQQRADQEQQRADQAEQQLEQERQRSQALADRLRAMGIDPEQVE